ncbi:MAG TPA: DUF2845 domain-containing protein [Solimonas sp.]
MKCAWLSALLLACGWSAVVEASNSIRCGSRLVAVGDSAAQLIGACGEPALRDAWDSGAVGYGAIAGIEQWTYNFGAGQLLRVVQLRQGVIQRIDAEGYGFHAADARRDCSAAAAIGPGMSKYRLLARCGAPLTRVADHRLVYPQARVAGSDWLRQRPNALIAVYREEWTYNFGGSKLMRIVTLDNGSVSELRMGPRGFD